MFFLKNFSSFIFIVLLSLISKSQAFVVTSPPQAIPPTQLVPTLSHNAVDCTGTQVAPFENNKESSPHVPLKSKLNQKLKYPFMLQMRISSFQQSRVRPNDCGAVLVHPRFAVTTAHCVANKNWYQALLRAGIQDLSDQNVFKNKVTRAFCHANYEALKHPFDIALLEFEKPFPEEITPVSLASRPPQQAQLLKALGWPIPKGYYFHKSLRLHEQEFSANLTLNSDDLILNNVTPPQASKLFCKTLSGSPLLDSVSGELVGLFKGYTGASVRLGYIAECAPEKGALYYTPIYNYKNWIENLLHILGAVENSYGIYALHLQSI